jgi:hypothetical protein
MQPPQRDCFTRISQSKHKFIQVLLGTHDPSEFMRHREHLISTIGHEIFHLIQEEAKSIAEKKETFMATEMIKMVIQKLKDDLTQVYERKLSDPYLHQGL